MNVNIKWDNEALVWVAINDDIGLAIEDTSYDSLISRIQIIIPEMCEINNIACDKTLNIHTSVRKVVCM